MRSLSLTLLLLQALVLKVSWAQINWQPGNWAMNCDFPGNDFASVAVAGSDCSTQCVITEGCSHYAWASGICYLKMGYVTKNLAVVSDSGVVCGISIFYDLGVTYGSLNFSYDFNSLSDVNSNWVQLYGNGGWGNQELEFYTNGDNNLAVSGGMLTIQSRIENYAGLNSQYTSARLVSTAKYRHGFFEMRAMLPSGRGTWPAFWLLAATNPLNWPADGEIDVMEEVGYAPNVSHGTIHCTAYNGMIGNQITNSVPAASASSQFHLYQLLWTPNNITMFIDNTPFFFYPKLSTATYATWPYDNYFNIIVNNAIGGSWGGIDGVDNSSFPNNYVIDYIRVYNL